MTLIQILAAIAFGLIVAFLMGCDGEYERLQSEAEWNAKVAHAATPKKGELVTIHQYADGRYVIRKYQGGLRETVLIEKEDQ